MQRIWRENGLSIVLFTLFFIFLAGQTLTGHSEYNQSQEEHGQPQVGLGEYVRTGHYIEAVFENWESEFLQMGAYVLFTAYLFQKGSAESKKLGEKEPVDEDPSQSKDDPNAPGPVKQGGWLLTLYKHSLSLAFVVLFLLSFSLHAIGGTEEYNSEQIEHGEQPVSVTGYLGTSRFWFESFQNWQSEFMAVGAIVVLSIFLREQGSPESKPVASPHSKTGSA
ncbi:MAG TPA: DUF6766 family protein [Ardenticatenaceae bacterium]|jgi:hypothetical protein